MVEINAGPLGYPLTKKGVREIRFLAKSISETEIDAVYSSPVFRAVESAKIMAGPYKVKVDVLQELSEAKLKPEFVGKPGRYHIMTTPEAFDETYEGLQKRMVRAVSTIDKKARGNAIIVSHGDPITVYLHHIIEGRITKNRYYALHPNTGSLSIVGLKGTPRLELFNYHRKLFDEY